MLSVVLTLALADGLRNIEVTVPGPAGALGGTLTLPSGAGRFPAVVTLTGSGGHFRDGNRTPTHPYRPFGQIADTLARCGVATLRLDDRGMGESQGDANAARAEDTAADAAAALRFLGARKDVLAGSVGLIGHSYGGVIAPMVAAEDSSVAAVVLMAAPARPFRDTMRYQNQYVIEHDPSIPAERRAAALEEATRRQELNVAASTEAWRKSIQDRDPLLTARRLKMPVLILQGLTDRAVSPEDAQMLEATIREGGNTRVETRFFPDVNHHFQHDPVGARAGYDQLPTQNLEPAFLKALCVWLPGALAHQ